MERPCPDSPDDVPGQGPAAPFVRDAHRPFFGLSASICRIAIGLGVIEPTVCAECSARRSGTLSDTPTLVLVVDDGHTCHRNLVEYGKITENLESVETPRALLEMAESLRNKPFSGISAG